MPHSKPAEARDRPLLLASGSAARRQMLTAAGVSFAVMPADVDEAAIRKAHTNGSKKAGAADIAKVLAEAKAEKVSADHPHALVIGADQVLALGDVIFEKPADLAAARDHLLQFRGKAHQLHSAVALAENGRTVWSTSDVAHMHVRAFTPEFLDHYLAAAGQAVCASVGAYQLEALGVQLFEKIDGDYFTILGMPLLPLLAQLRARGFAKN